MFPASCCHTLQFLSANYATQNSTSRCHLMTQWHLPEWREEEWAFVHSGSLGLNHAITSEFATDLSNVSSINLWWFHVNTMGVASIELSKTLFGIQLPLCANSCSLSCHRSGKCCCGIYDTCHYHPEWHKFPPVQNRQRKCCAFLEINSYK